MSTEIYSPTTERLFTLRVKDLMNPQVIAIHEHESMWSAARKLQEKEISGAPVVDHDGKCVGMITSSDFVAWQSGGDDEYITKHPKQEPWNIERQNDDLVSSHMSSGVLTISEKTLLLTAASQLCAHHIHRLVVVDDEQRPIGMITSLDFVAAIVGIGEDYYGR